MEWKYFAADLCRSDFPVADLTHVPAESYIERWFELYAYKLPTDVGQIRIDLNEVQIL